MRLCERTLIHAELAPRMRKTGALGGAAEGFSEERISFRASRLPEEGGISAEKRGAVPREGLNLLAAADVPAKAGDGVWAEGKLYRILSVRRWTAHVELACEVM